MKKTEITIKELLTQFEKASIEHAQATLNGNHPLANRNYKVIAKVTTLLKEQNKIIVLNEFLHHPSAGVRLWAASYLLMEKNNNNIALNVLKDIVKMGGILSLNAEYTISEWEKDN